MYIQNNTVKAKNGKTYKSVLLCHKYREEGKVKTKVVANLSKLPAELVLSIKNILKFGKGALVSASDIFVEKSIDYGLVLLLIHVMKKLRIVETLEKVVPEKANLLQLIILGKVLTRGSKLGIYNWIKRYPQIADKLRIDLSALKVDDLYQSLGMGWYRQEQIEKKWFRYHSGVVGNDIYLYDITSTYFEGVENELAAFGYNRDGKKGKMQICIGLVANSNGFPIKIQAFEGNISDQKTVLGQIDNLKNEFKVGNVIFVGDRGMKIRYNLDQLDDAEKQGVEYITGLEHSEIQSMIQEGAIQLGLFSKELAEIEHESTRYILSLNPDLQASELEFLNKQKLKADEELAEIFGSWKKRHEKNLENIEKLKKGHKNKKLVTSFTKEQLDKFTVRAAMALKKRFMAKYFQVKVSGDNFDIRFDQQQFDKSCQLSGKYVLCTNVDKEKLNKEQVRGTYKCLQNVEHAFRDFKSNNIQLRPVFHRNEAQTRGHVLVSMFSYAIVKQLEDKIFPWLKLVNKNRKSKLSFQDALEELRDIKLCTLNIGKNEQIVKTTELNQMQDEILKLFKFDKKMMDKMV